MRRRVIGERMGTSENAIKYHIANIGSKLGVSGLAALRQWPGYPADSPLVRRSTSMTTATASASPATTPAVGPLGQVSPWAPALRRTQALYPPTLGPPP